MPAASRQRKVPTLTAKQQRFVDAYVGKANLNASEAVRMAGYKTDNPNDMGYQLRNTPHIRARIDAILAENTLSAPEVLVMLRKDATRSDADILKLAMDAHASAGTNAGGPTISALVSARSNALQNLARAHGLLTDKQTVDVNIREHVRAVPQSTLERITRPAERRADA